MKNTRLVYSTDAGDQRKSKEASAAESAKTPSSGSVTIRLDTKGRKGKVATLITGITGHPGRDEICKRLKSLCGAGGTVEEDQVLVQGDHRDKIAAELTAQGFRVKRI